jgi:hypothetical protein
VLADFEESGDEDVVRKVAGDLAEKGVSAAKVREKLNALLAEAVAQIQAGK